MKTRKIYERLKKAAPYRNPFLQIIDIIWHKLKINTHPADYYLYEFYKGGKSWDEKKGYIGRYGSYYWPYETIALKDMIVLTNKYIQKHILRGMGLPAPELLATAGQDYTIRSHEGLKSHLAAWNFDIVIKPISSTGGANVNLLGWADGRFFGMEGEEWSSERIWEYLSRHKEVGCLIERRVFNVGQTAKIHPYSLNTYRIITIRSQDGKWHVPSHMIKFGCGKSCVDNITVGGIMVNLDENGVAIQALGEHFTRPLTHHPDTGLPILGVQPEGFKDVIALALRASHKFRMLSTIGWDIAYTAEGPVIIEGNTLWGGNYQLFFGPVVDGELTKGLKRHHFYSRYSREHIFPRLQKKSRWPWRRIRWWA